MHTVACRRAVGRPFNEEIRSLNETIDAKGGRGGRRRR
jgi:hypothetical protein